MDQDQSASLVAVLSGFIVFVSLIKKSGVHFDICSRHEKQKTFSKQNIGR